MCIYSSIFVMGGGCVPSFCLFLLTVSEPYKGNARSYLKYPTWHVGSVCVDVLVFSFLGVLSILCSCTDAVNPALRLPLDV